MESDLMKVLQKMSNEVDAVVSARLSNMSSVELLLAAQEAMASPLKAKPNAARAATDQQGACCPEPATASRNASCAPLTHPPQRAG